MQKIRDLWIYLSIGDTNLAPPPKKKKFLRGEWRHVHVCPWAFFRVLRNIEDFRVSRKLILLWTLADTEVIYLKFEVSVKVR